MAIFRIGVDVGGTNTDGVLLDPSATAQPNKGILAWHKSPTTPDPSRGIESVITTLLRTAKVDDARAVASVTIGTTHFIINAVLEKDWNRLAPVAVVRLCGPFSRDVYPAIDWPEDLRGIICQYCGFVDGGLEIDGEPIRNLDESQIAAECEIIKKMNIRCIVLNGIFSPSDTVHKQEERVADGYASTTPEAEVVISKEVANLGFIERENAAILNASILPFARSTIRSFEHAMTRLQLQCPLFITQNDGTILPARLAARLPIRTFSSGPTNSMCGAAFLYKDETDKENMLVVDMVYSLGGTSTDAAAVMEISGVRMNFSCPDVKSIGLGGGSIVRKGSTTAKLTVGPDSVGHHIQHRALVFGGDVATATDYAVVSQGLSDIGDAGLVPPAVKKHIQEYTSVVIRCSSVSSTMKTTDADIPVLLVGGGAILAPDTLSGASRVVKPAYSSVANAIGAAIARMAVDKAVENGATRESVKIAEIDAIPVNYIANNPAPAVNTKREWIISEIDLEWISTGCYILGTGGGGTPYPHFVRLREMMRNGAVVRDSAVVACGGGKGSPTVSIEKLPANEQMEAPAHGVRQARLPARRRHSTRNRRRKRTAGMLLGASNKLNVPTVDGDWMGRAYPVSWQITPVVLGGDKAHFLPTAIADGNGNNMLLLSGASEKLIERIFRAALSRWGATSRAPRAPAAARTPRHTSSRTLSHSPGVSGALWLSVAPRTKSTRVADAIIEQVGGRDSAKLLFKGKIVSVERRTVKGHVYGEVVISASGVEGPSEFSGLLKIPFKNENIMASVVDAHGRRRLCERAGPYMCSDASNGEAIGTPEYRYGLVVFVIGIQASEKWTATSRGIQIGGPRAFGMDVDYKPLGIFRKPRLASSSASNSLRPKNLVPS
ncbi:hypothetical protein B0H14DRAFT_3109634 [Mycena olivaceomarginata]|nr:hypothetical protein B0H14DRAFT_3109634 [Mycena olivaceomarginata]